MQTTAHRQKPPPRIAQIPCNEVRAVAERVVSHHSEAATRIACLIHLHRHMVRKHERDTGHSLAAMTDLHCECVRAWAVQENVNIPDIRAALTGLEQAQGTLDYLDSLPD